MIRNNLRSITTLMLVVGVLASGMRVTPVGAQTVVPAGPAVAGGRSHYQPNRFAGRAGKYYQLVWGVDSLGLKAVESGEVIRFTYRVLDANKAKALNDKKSEPF